MGDSGQRLSALQLQSAQAVEGYLIEAIEILDRNLTPEFFEKNPQLLGEMVKAMAIQNQADVEKDKPNH
ncbi:hypothetical protein [Aidingimonas halophila]|uniref:Uncharacterized protein n=1 Tax=Aidingimonas halophila TaxID=574349 RepID=A0A1H2RFP6_9GAMM|nr:hypothetical protein [Aidingimonas halophila]GHC19343.1 hypothetical protein GCM10008094_06660 [Aidingimonas halophila]SDW18048.1 hypothetical protein SAMN05443545_101307 [Aidingimonas halophila]